MMQERPATKVWLMLAAAGEIEIFRCWGCHHRSRGPWVVLGGRRGLIAHYRLAPAAAWSRAPPISGAVGHSPAPTAADSAPQHLSDVAGGGSTPSL